MAESRHQNFKSPPAMKEDLIYPDWKKELEIWSDFTDLAPEKQGGALFLTLSGKARQAVLSGVPRDLLKAKDSLQAITECLDELYLKDESQCGFAAFDEFTAYRRPLSAKIEDYLVEFNLKYNKIKSYNMTLPEGVLAYYLLKCANLPEEQANICRATCSVLKYKDMRVQIEKVTSTSTSDPSNSANFQDVQNQYYAYDIPDEYEQYDEVDEEADYTQEAYFTKASYRPQNTRPSTSVQKPRQNPLDEFGNPSQCTFCHSIFHWYDKCPHVARSSTYSRPYPNMRRPGRGRGGYRGNRGRGNFNGNL